MTVNLNLICKIYVPLEITMNGGGVGVTGGGSASAWAGSRVAKGPRACVAKGTCVRAPNWCNPRAFRGRGGDVTGRGRLYPPPL
jgi:hypothetical protein